LTRANASNTDTGFGLSIRRLSILRIVPEPGQNTRKVSDPAQLREITERLFARLPVRILEPTGEKAVHVAGARDGILDVRHQLPEAAARVLTLVHGEHRMLLECHVLSHEGGAERLKPVRLILHQRQIRSEPRVETTTGSLFLTNCLPVTSVFESFAIVDERRDQMVEALKLELKKRYSDAQLVLRRSSRVDSRMRLMSQHYRPVYFSRDPDAMKEIDDRFVPAAETEKSIRAEGFPGHFLCEASFPLIYHRTLIFGYLQILSPAQMQPDHWDEMGALATKAEKALLPFLPTAPDKCPVADLSMHGIGFLHGNNQFVLRHFMPGTEITFDLHFPDGFVAGCLASIRNLRSKERTHRVGAELKPLRPVENEHLTQYLAELNSRAVDPARSG
jgi:hypothetical protein